MDLKNQILVALGLDKEEVLMAFQAKLEDGTFITSTADELIAGVDIAVLSEDGTVIPLEAGTYVLESGESFSVEESGIVAEVFGAEDVEEEAPVEEELAEEADVADWEGMEKRIQNLEDAVASLKGEEKEVEEEVEEMSEEAVEPSVNPKSIKTTEVVEFSAETTLEDLKAENERLKTELAAQPASAPLDTNKFSSEKTSLSKKELKMMTSQERFLYNLNN